MISWTSLFAVLAVASAAPQIQPIRTETIRVQQVPVSLNTVQSVPVQYQAAPVQYQSAPLQYQSTPVQYQSTPVQYQSVPVQIQSVPVQYHSIQSVPVQSVGVQSVQSVPAVHQVHQIPLSNVPVSNIRLQDIKPANVKTTVTQVRAQPTPLPVIHATPTPTVRYSSTPVSVPVHVQHVQTVQHVPVAPVAPRITQVTVPVQTRVQTNARSEGGFAILRQIQDVQADGTYEFAYETENGIKAQEHGELRNPGTENEIEVVSGSYSYTAPDGTPITVNYVADENGFRAEGDHIPKTPEAILRSLEYLRSLPPSKDDE